MRVGSELTPTVGVEPGNARPPVRDEPGIPAAVRFGGPGVAPPLGPPHHERAVEPTNGLHIRDSESPPSYEVVVAGREWVAERPADPDSPSALDRDADHGIRIRGAGERSPLMGFLRLHLSAPAKFLSLARGLSHE